MKRNLLDKAKKPYLIFVLVLMLLIVTLYGLFLISKSRSFQFFGEIIPRFQTDKKLVALTFDDGPTLYTDEVLQILAQKSVKATFYVIGQNLEKYPLEGKRIVGAGHELGNHSYSHQRMLIKSPAFVATEIEKTNQLIRELGYDGDITFRPPFGKKLFVLPWYLDQHSIKTIMVDVEAETYLPKLNSSEEETTFLIDFTVKKTQPGSIILLHPLCESCGASRAAIEKIIDDLHDRGYTFVTVSELLRS